MHAPSRRNLTPRTIVQLLIIILILPFLPLLLSGRWNWWEAWVYGGVNVLGFFISRILAARRHPDLILERAQSMQHKDTKPFDKILAPLVGIGAGFIPLVTGLDAAFGWSEGFSLSLEMVALVCILAGFSFGTWALVENRFFSGVVRIQTDRGHHVVNSGPYGWVRHPGYSGALLTYFASPVFLDSWYALIASFALAVLLVIRTRLEDNTLQEELPGYREYAGKVKYKILPWIW